MSSLSPTEYGFYEFVMEKVDYFSNTHFWPTHRQLDPRTWLSNFSSEEKHYALHLLNFFCFFSADLTNTLFKHALSNVSNYYRKFFGDNKQWQKICNNTYITYVSGENPNPADSGYLFTRKARDYCGIAESNIIDHNTIFREPERLRGTNLIFVDDFIGSGSQIITCLKKQIKSDGNTFIGLCKEYNITILYCPLVSTKLGLERIHNFSKNLIILPVHVLGSSYNVFAENSLCWKGELRENGIKVIEVTSRRAGIPMIDSQDVNYWQGFCKLGLALGFDHCTPDATIPIFTWNQNGWKPLIRK